MKKVTVVDYGISNLLSIKRALEYCGTDVLITNSPHDVKQAERLILPGVGAFGNGMDGLRAKGLIDPIKEFAAQDRPFLGICLGMQMMMDKSSEFGIYEGLGLIHGAVQAIPNTGVDERPHKIPHIGWNGIEVPQDCNGWNNTILTGIDSGSFVYFIHSYTPVPERENDRLADCFYNGRRLSAVIRSGYLYGCQFHPEKSGSIGLKLLQNWTDI